MVAWMTSIDMKKPTAMGFSRQNAVFMSRTEQQIEDIRKGAYVLYENDMECQLVIMATGTEVGIALEAGQRLAGENIGVRVVSMPSTDVFDMQTEEYKNSVLPNNVRARLAVEAGVTDFWRKYVGLDGDVVGLDEFGLSAPGNVLMEHFGFTADNVFKRAKALI
jgi:transketolase